MGIIYNDFLHTGQTILDRTELSTELRIFLTKQSYTLDRFLIAFRIYGLPPCSIERVAVLDAKPGRIHPACDGADANNYNSRG
jgi:hypothetical protein